MAFLLPIRLLNRSKLLFQRGLFRLTRWANSIEYVTQQRRSGLAQPQPLAWTISAFTDSRVQARKGNDRIRPAEPLPVAQFRQDRFASHDPNAGHRGQHRARLAFLNCRLRGKPHQPILDPLAACDRCVEVFQQVLEDPPFFLEEIELLGGLPTDLAEQVPNSQRVACNA